MKLAQFLTAAALLATTATIPAHAGLLTFDDLTYSDVGSMPGTYEGFTFNHWYFINSPPYSFHPASGITIIYNAESPYSNAPEILFGGSYDVLSVYLEDYSASSVTLRGYSGATELYNVTIAVTGAMVKHTLNFMGIDRFVMEVPDTRYSFLDNLEFEPSSDGTDGGGGAAAEVAEPGALALLGLGLAGVSAMRRRQRYAI
ncbi:PEP-CTERM sorting domain-containing protein [Pseudoduganella sp. RAF53_2]|uniref:PEP-CTERM sorting domain-containing protein n=1 Tax=unclassified Pseudoduganella TaxID=2637179 RepID=UPI003F95D22D